MRTRIIPVSILILLTLLAVTPLMCQIAKAQTQYSVTIWAWDHEGGWQVPVKIYRDGVDTGFTTPATFIDQTGTHTYSVPNVNSWGSPFSDWDEGGSNWTDTTLTVSSGGTYTARYRAGYSVTIWGWDYIDGWEKPVSITKDGVPTGFSTPYTFTDLTGIHTFAVPYSNSAGHPFSDWSNDWTDPTLIVNSAGVYTARYREGYSVTIRGWCHSESWISRPISLDNSPTGYNTPRIFYLIGTHTIEVPGYDENGHVFYGWNEGFSSSPTLTVSSAGVFTAHYATQPEGSMTINSGAEYTSSASVDVWMETILLDSFVGTFSDARWRVSNDGVWDTEPWLLFSEKIPWTLTPGDGVKIVYYQLKDTARVSQTYSNSIILDTTAPTGSITINDGANSTDSTSVTLKIVWGDNLATFSQILVRFSNDGVWDTEQWEPLDLSNTRSWVLLAGEGTKTVYFQVKDAAGLLSPTYSDTITLTVVIPEFSEFTMFIMLVILTLTVAGLLRKRN